MRCLTFLGIVPTLLLTLPTTGPDLTGEFPFPPSVESISHAYIHLFLRPTPGSSLRSQETVTAGEENQCQLAHIHLRDVWVIVRGAIAQHDLPLDALFVVFARQQVP
jgi:hypothetical protein